MECNTKTNLNTITTVGFATSISTFLSFVITLSYQRYLTKKLDSQSTNFVEQAQIELSHPHSNQLSTLSLDQEIQYLKYISYSATCFGTISIISTLLTAGSFIANIYTTCDEDYGSNFTNPDNTSVNNLTNLSGESANNGSIN